MFASRRPKTRHVYVCVCANWHSNWQATPPFTDRQLLSVSTLVCLFPAEVVNKT